MTGDQVHVLHVVRTLGKSGGLERNLYRIVKALVGRGIQHSIALLSDFPDIIDFTGLAEVHRISTPPNDPWLVGKLRRLLQELRPTVVHARNFGAWPDVAIARHALWSSPPLIFSYHGSEATTDLIPTRQRLAFQALAPLTNRIFAVSQATRRLLQEGYGLKRYPVEVLSNGVDTERFHPGAPHPAGPLVVGSAGRLHEVKNFGLLLEAAALARDEGVELEVRLAGDGTELPRLEARAQRLGLPVHFLGHTEDIPGFLRDLDVFMLTSDNEANPNVLLEAMATGLPAVATEVGGVPEVTLNGQAALLAPKGDAVQLGQALTRLARSPELRASLGATARKTVLEHHAQARMFDAYEQLYRQPRVRP